MLKFYKFIFILAFVLKLSIVASDYYSAISDLEYILDSEAYIIEKFGAYMSKVKATLEHIEKFIAYVESKYTEDVDSIEDYLSDPVNAYKKITRLVTHWKRHVHDNVFDTNIFEAYKKNLTALGTVDGPTNKDLLGAIKGLHRLQDTYALSTNDMADGILQNVQLGSILSASDCFEIGRHLCELKEYKLAIEWLLAARARMSQDLGASGGQQSIPSMSEVQILEYLVPALYNNGNTKLAQKLNNDLLLIDSQNAHGLNNTKLFESQKAEEVTVSGIEAQISDETAEDDEIEKENRKQEHQNVFELYKRVCREELRQTPREQRHLRCRLTSNNVPYYYIAPFKMEELNHDPFVAHYHEAIYEQEITKIIELGKNSVERSQVGEVNSSVVSDIRTSKNTWLWYEEHSFLDNLKQRLEDITGLSTASAEPLQVANYGIGGQYEPHYDFVESPEKNFGKNGNRILTALFYINDVEMGGSTAFPFLRLAVPPIRGSLLVWYNMHESLEKDYRTKHAGCPVLKGSKWICNEWFHEGGQEFRRPCNLAPEGTKSAAYEKFW